MNAYLNSRREVRLEHFELQDKLSEANELSSLTNSNFVARCTLEIFTVDHKDTLKGMKLICGEDLWKDQKMGHIRTRVNAYGHDDTKIILPEAFIIPADSLLVNFPPSTSATNTTNRGYRLGLADHYFVKIWLEAPTPVSEWPPLELRSRLEYGGQMQKWLQEGTFSNSDIRLCCKGVFDIGKSACNGFEISLKLGDIRFKTRYTLKVDIQYSLPTPSLESTWRTSRHVLKVLAKKNISDSCKEYMLKWDSFVAPLQLSANAHVPATLIKFVEEHSKWFAEQRARIKEFSLHATALHLRGIIDIDCLAICTRLLPQPSEE